MRDRAPPSGVEGRALVVSPRSQKAFKIQKAKTPITWPSDTLHVHLPVWASWSPCRYSNLRNYNALTASSYTKRFDIGTLSQFALSWKFLCILNAYWMTRTISQADSTSSYLNAATALQNKGIAKGGEQRAYIPLADNDSLLHTNSEKQVTDNFR